MDGLNLATKIRQLDSGFEYKIVLISAEEQYEND